MCGWIKGLSYQQLYSYVSDYAIASVLTLELSYWQVPPILKVPESVLVYNKISRVPVVSEESSTCREFWPSTFINYVMWWILISCKKFWKALNVYVYLWLQAVLYDWTNIVSIWLHCSDLIHSAHKEFTIQKLFMHWLLTTYASSCESTTTYT